MSTKAKTKLVKKQINKKENKEQNNLSQDLIDKNSKISELLDKIKYYDKLYNSEKFEETISDEDYDKLVKELSELDPLNPFFENKIFEELPFNLPSLNKINCDNEEDLNRFMKWYLIKLIYIVSDKLDGISCLYFKKNDKSYIFKKNNTEVKEITKYIPYINFGFDLNTLPNNICVRGELIIPKSKWVTMKGYKVQRNAVNGLLSCESKKFKIKEYDQFIDFVAYSIYDYESQHNLENDYKKLKNYGFKVVNHFVFDIPKNFFKKNSDNLEEFKEILKKLENILVERKIESEYTIDGIVLTKNDFIFENDFVNPGYSIAIKNLSSILTTKVLKINWVVGKDKYISCSLDLEPVKYTDGSDMTRVTGINAKYLYERNIGPNSVIEIIKSGEIVPKIYNIIEATGFQYPEFETHWCPNKVYLISDVENSNKLQEIVFFFKIMKIKEVSDKTIEKFYNFGYDSLEKIINADKKVFYNLEGLGEKSVNKIYDNLETQLKTCDISKIMSGSNIFGRNIGEIKISQIINSYPELFLEEDIDTIYNNILEIKGIGKLTAKNFSEKISDFKNFIQKINYGYRIEEFIDKKKSQPNNIDIIDETDEKLQNNFIYKKNIVFTGIGPKEMEPIILNNGGILQNNVKKDTDILVFNGQKQTSNNHKKAISYGIKEIYEINEFKKKLYEECKK